MAEFASPRFQDEPWLLEILNDPDTGTKKLQVGDQGSDVQAVQQALFDLAWTWRIHPSFPDEHQFVIGTFGPVTHRVVQAYKTHHDITFPGAPPGTYTGTAGPRTLARLDADIVEYDQSQVDIAVHFHELVSEGWDLVLDDHEQPQPRTWIDSGGTFYPLRAWGEIGMIVWSPQAGAWELHDPILGEWLDRDRALGPLGFPISDLYGDEHGNLLCDFEGGTLHYDTISETAQIIDTPSG